jgi:hypothetical protein
MRAMSILLGVVLSLGVAGCSGNHTVRPSGEPAAPGSGMQGAVTGFISDATATIEGAVPEPAQPPAPATKTGSSALHSPKLGDPERKAILDALRIPVQKELSQPVKFKVTRINVKSDFAFVQGQPLRPNGDTIDYTKTKFAVDVKEGYFDDGVLALLQRTDGAWHVLEYAIGATDFPAQEWAETHHAPVEILGF